MTAPIHDYKYTDRDVREDPHLAELAVAYVLQYGGDFEPLVEAKMVLQDGGQLTTSNIRRVLNCMRHDYDVAQNMPPPKRNTAKVVQLATRRKRRGIDFEDEGDAIDQCSNVEPHYTHRWPGKKNKAPYYARCNGVPFPINRSGRVFTRAKIKAPFITSRTGYMVHKTTGQAKMFWSVPRHEWGWNHTELYVKSACKNPSWIVNGILYNTEPVHLYEDDTFGKKPCPYCFDLGNKEHE